MMLQTITDSRGSLTVAEKLPFPIKRVYFLHGVKGERGGHAQRITDRVMVAMAGSFNVRMRGRKRWKDVTLNNPSEALRIPPMTWLELDDFSPDAVCMVIASTEFDESDSIREFSAFLREARTAA